MATATAGVGLVGGAAKFFGGKSMQKKGEKFIENFKWNDLKNPYKDESVSTLGADMRREEAARTTATTVDALGKAGARELVGGIGKVQDANNKVNKDIGAGLDKQQKAINTRAAGQEVVNQNMMEKRQGDELAGYGQMMNTGMGMKSQGIDGMVNAVGAFGASGAGEKLDNKLWGV